MCLFKQKTAYELRISYWSSDVCSSDLGIAELATFDPQEDEEEALAAERSDLQKGARLAGELTTVNELLLGSEGGLSQLRQAARRLEIGSASCRERVGTYGEVSVGSGQLKNILLLQSYLI